MYFFILDSLKYFVIVLYGGNGFFLSKIIAGGHFLIVLVTVTALFIVFSLLQVLPVSVS